MRPRPIVGPLLPPNTPPDLPHGLERGGVFDADYVPGTYIDARRQTVPTDSPSSHNVASDIYGRPVVFARPDQAVPVTGMRGYGQLPTVVYDPAYQGFGRTYQTSYDQGHRHSVAIPNRHGMGRFIQGMGPQRGFIRERVGPPPLPIRNWRPVRVPHGMTEGGIFGNRRMLDGPPLPYVPQVVHRDVLIERTTRPLGGSMSMSFGAGPDGLGCGGGGCG